MPGNSKKNGNPVGNGKNQVALEEVDRGTFQEVLTPKNAVVLGTDGNETVDNSSGALDSLIDQVAAALDGYDADAVRQALVDIGVYDEGSLVDDTSDDTALIGDVVDLGAGNDVMWGDDNQVDTTGSDIILGGDGNDQLRGDGGNDALFGEDGNDVLNGDEGDDYMAGGTGNDVYHVDSADDLVVENADEGEDTVVSRIPGADLDLGDYPNIENGTLHEDAGEVDLFGTDGDNVLIGNSFDNQIDGLGGDDTIFGGDGDDTIDGGAGDDTIDGGKGDDGIVGGTGQDTLFGGNGGDDDTINVGTAGSLDGRDAEDDVIVAAGSYAENGTDAIFNYDESSHPAVNNDDVFDFSEAFDFTSADSNLWAGELDTFLTFDQANGEIETAGDSTQVWFTVSELDATETFNPAEQVSVLVDNALFMNDGTGWTLVDADIMV